jgi:hypothetical protein
MRVGLIDAVASAAPVCCRWVVHAKHAPSLSLGAFWPPGVVACDFPTNRFDAPLTRDYPIYLPGRVLLWLCVLSAREANTSRCIGRAWKLPWELNLAAQQ